jgi:hypothetical protein
VAALLEGVDDEALGEEHAATLERCAACCWAEEDR